MGWEILKTEEIKQNTEGPPLKRNPSRCKLRPVPSPRTCRKAGCGPLSSLVSLPSSPGWVCWAGSAPRCYSQPCGWPGDWQQGQLRAAACQASPGAGRELRKERRETRGGRKRGGFKEEEVQLAPERQGQGSLGFGWKRKAKKDKMPLWCLPQQPGRRCGVGRNRSATFCLFGRRVLRFLWDLPGGFTTFLPCLRPGAF